jgi:hypothetical protein
LLAILDNIAILMGVCSCLVGKWVNKQPQTLIFVYIYVYMPNMEEYPNDNSCWEQEEDLLPSFFST